MLRDFEIDRPAYIQEMKWEVELKGAEHPREKIRDYCISRLKGAPELREVKEGITPSESQLAAIRQNIELEKQLRVTMDKKEIACKIKLIERI